MSSLTAVKSAIDLLDWKSADMAAIKEVIDGLLDSMDADLEEVAFDESSITEQYYGKLRKLLDEEDLKLFEEEEEAAEAEENGEENGEEVEGEDDEDEDEDDIEYEDDEEEEVVVEKPTTE